jgi:hypothetical protein
MIPMITKNTHRHRTSQRVKGVSRSMNERAGEIGNESSPAAIKLRTFNPVGL